MMNSVKNELNRVDSVSFGQILGISHYILYDQDF